MQSIAAQPSRTSDNDFYRPRTPRQAALAEITTAQDTYFVGHICGSSTPHTRTARHSLAVTRLSDGARAPGVDHLLLKATGRCSASGVGTWASLKEAADAVLLLGVRHFEGRGVVALSNPVTGAAFVHLDAVSG